MAKKSAKPTKAPSKSTKQKMKMPDINQIMPKISGSNIKSLKIKLKFHKDKGDKDDKD